MSTEITRYYAMKCSEQDDEGGVLFGLRWSGDPAQVNALPSNVKVTCFGCLGQHIATECTKEEWDQIGPHPDDEGEPLNELRVTAGDGADA